MVELVLAQAEDFLQDVAVVGWMVAGIGGRCAGQEGCFVAFRAGGIAEQVGDPVDRDYFNTCRG